jgi:hypothetical protein
MTTVHKTTKLRQAPEENGGLWTAATGGEVLGSGISA